MFLIRFLLCIQFIISSVIFVNKPIDAVTDLLRCNANKTARGVSVVLAEGFSGLRKLCLCNSLSLKVIASCR